MFIQNFFIEDNALEYVVCKIAAILSRPHFVKKHWEILPYTNPYCGSPICMVCFINIVYRRSDACCHQIIYSHNVYFILQQSVF